MDLNYTGDINQYLNRKLKSGESSGLNSAFGFDDSRSNYDFSSNGNIYRLENGTDGTRSVRLTGSVAEQQAKKAKAEQDALLAKQRAETDARFAENRSFLGGMVDDFGKAVPEITNRAYQNFNIPGLLDSTNALKGRVDDLKSNLTGTGAGGYASAGQVDAAINTNYLPRYLSSNEQLQKGVSLAQNQIGTELIPWTTKIDTMAEQVAREATGYSVQQQRELDTLLDQYHTGVALTQAQQARLDSLAASEKNYALEADKLAESKRQFDAGNTTAGKDNYITVGGSLYNLATGQWITAPKSANGTGDPDNNPWLT